MTNKQHILFVDDEAICHDVIRLLLSTSRFRNHNIISAYNGSEALELATAHANELDLILLDIMLPDMTGYALYKRIKESPYLAHIPIIFQSGMPSTDKETQQLLQENGLPEKGIYMVRKPYKNDELLHLLEQCAPT